MNDSAPASDMKPARKPRPSPQDKIAVLKAQLAAAEAEAKEAEAMKANIVGRHIIAAMHDDPALAAQISALLRDRVRNARDRAAIASLLV